eukprot:293157-Prymnesium_polylepis.2
MHCSRCALLRLSRMTSAAHPTRLGMWLIQLPVVCVCGAQDPEQQPANDVQERYGSLDFVSCRNYDTIFDSWFAVMI